MKNNDTNNLNISYNDEKVEELKQQFKSINFQFKMARITHTLKCIFTLRFNQLIPKKNSQSNNINIDDMINDLDKKLEEFDRQDTKKFEGNLEKYIFIRLITLSNKDYNLWKQDSKQFVSRNKNKWNNEYEIISQYIPFMQSEKHEKWLYYITSTIEGLSNKKYKNMLNEAESFINKHLDRFNKLNKKQLGGTER